MKFRFKLEIRGLMLLVAFAALALGLHQRSRRLERIAMVYSGRASVAETERLGLSETSNNGPSQAVVDEMIEMTHWNDSVAEAYRQAARRPWFPIDPDPGSIACRCKFHTRVKPRASL